MEMAACEDDITGYDTADTSLISRGACQLPLLTNSGYGYPSSFLVLGDYNIPSSRKLLKQKMNNLE